jgi:hypothetical protein
VNLDQTNVNIPADPATVILTVTAPGACTWTVQSNVTWANFIVSALREVRNSLTLSGTRALAIDIRRNTSSVAQSGTVVVNGSALTINQAGSTDAANLRFVYAMFNNFLVREPGQAGVDFFLPLLNSGALGRSQMAYNMFSAAEFNIIERYVIGLYYGILGRDPDYYGWDFHRRNMHLGVVQQDTLARDFLNSAEYALRYGNPTNAGFVLLMYQNALGRTPPAPDLAYWQGLLDNNTATRVQVAQAILNSPEFQQGHSTRQTVFLMHATMLSREPGDFGYQYWIDSLNGGMPLSTAVNAFIFSPEFQIKLGP